MTSLKKIGILKSEPNLPGFGLSIGYTLLYLGLMVLIPLAGLLLFTLDAGFETLWLSIQEPRVISALKVSLITSFIAAAINTIMGLILAWVLVRYSFPFKKLIDSIIDLPFALPTAVSGIALVTLYSKNGWIGKHFESFDIPIAFTTTGIVVALIMIGLPFVVRTVQPVLENFDREVEEAAKTLGASRFQRFRRVIFPTVLPSLIAGFSMAFARGIGEYGSVIFIAGNMPMKTEIAPLLIVIKLEQYDYIGATAIAFSMLVFSFLVLLVLNGIQWWSSRHQGS
jgi:sulfate transport system permease protein